MRIVRGLESYPPDAGESAVALGVFDGIHLGHRATLTTAVGEARRHGLVALACTFDPHPLELLRTLGARLGFRAHVVAPLVVDRVPVSSSEVRAALQAGDVERAARLLGRPYSAEGEVVRGAGRGRTLGFPTANVKPDHPLAL